MTGTVVAKTPFVNTSSTYIQKDSNTTEQFSTIFKATSNKENLSDEKTVKETSYEKTKQSFHKKENLITKKTNTLEEDQEMIAEVATQFIAELSRVLDVPVEQIIQLQDDLNLTDAQLLMDGSFTKIMLATNQEVDAISLMTDESMFESMKEIESILSKLLENSTITSELLTEVDSNLYVETEGEKEVIASKELIVQSEVSSKSQEITQKNDTQVVQEVESEQDMNGLVKDISSKEQSDSKEQNESNGSKNNDTLTFMQKMELNLEQVLDVKLDAEVSKSVSAKDIIDQITEFMKINMNEEITELEMQLNPASLGTINIQISSKEGVLTALFKTQDEAVKTMVESQIVQLKDSLENQGIKVEAVEVTIASHAFERNLEQGNDDRNSSNETKKQAKTRKVQLIDLEETEELEESEQLTAKIMKENGNTLDYIV